MSAVVAMATLVSRAARTSLSGRSFLQILFNPVQSGSPSGWTVLYQRLFLLSMFSLLLFSFCSVCWTVFKVAHNLCAFGQDIVKLTVLQRYCDRTLENVRDAGDVFKRQTSGSSRHICCTICTECADFISNVPLLCNMNQMFCTFQSNVSLLFS